jgi:uncharacterized DUF497 family protein
MFGACFTARAIFLLGCRNRIIDSGEACLDDPLSLTIEDESSEGKPRWITIGANASGELLVVVWTERDDGRAVNLCSKSHREGA